MAAFLSRRLGLHPKSFQLFSSTVSFKPYPQIPQTLLFHRLNHGFTRSWLAENLLCNGVKVEDVMDKVGKRPFYLYSKPQITTNFKAHEKATKDFNAMIGFEVKANNNLHILKHLSSLGCGAATVNGNELRLALRAGFSPSKIVLNGSGNPLKDLVFAAREGVLVTIDNEFDLEDIISAAKISQKKVNILLRVNPDLEPKLISSKAHPCEDSEFSNKDKKLQWFVDAVKAHPYELNLVGVHCHLGPTISNLDIYRDALVEMTKFVDEISAYGLEIKYMNIKGGMQIRSFSTGDVPTTPKDLINTVRKEDLPKGVTLIIESGRSLVENSCCFVNRVTGIKSNGDKKIIVVDRDAEELIRCSHISHQDIELVSYFGTETSTYDVVVPNCQSENLLRKGLKLPTPVKGAGLVVHNAGDYCMRKASFYDPKTCPAEYWVDDDGKVVKIRREYTLEDYTSLYEFDTEKSGASNSKQQKHHEKEEILEEEAEFFKTGDWTWVSNSKQKKHYKKVEIPEDAAEFCKMGARPGMHTKIKRDGETIVIHMT